MANIGINTILFAVAGGVLPTFFWLWFWLAQNDYHIQADILLLAYMGGALGIMAILPLRPYIEPFASAMGQTTLIYAAIEEIAKVAIVGAITFRKKLVSEPTDYTVYLVTGALGFSALENTFYLIAPILQNSPLNSIIVTGNLRFFGATVLHTVSVAIVGVLLGLAYSANTFVKFIHLVIGIAMGIGLHTAFNYFIMKDTRQSTIIAIAGIWFVAVIVILLFDRLRAMQENLKDPRLAEKIGPDAYQEYYKETYQIN